MCKTHKIKHINRHGNSCRNKNSKKKEQMWGVRSQNSENNENKKKKKALEGRNDMQNTLRPQVCMRRFIRIKK